MESANDALILDLVDWVAAAPRTYAEAMQAWRTSCPRLTIWEDAFDRGYIARGPRGDGIPVVTVTARGLDLLAAEGRRPGGREG